MKKPDPHRDHWLLSQRTAKAKRRIRFQRYTKLRNGAGRGVQHPLVNRFNPEQEDAQRGRLQIILPERLDLEENYEVTVTNLTNVRMAASGAFRLRNLSFDRLRYISPAAALMLASEVDRWNDSVGRRLRARHKKWDPHVRHLLCQMGFFELLGLPRPAQLTDVINTTFLPFRRGNVTGVNSGALAKNLRTEIESVAGIQIRRHLLYEGLTEAVTNVCQHAYFKSPSAAKRYEPFWVFASFNAETNTVVVVVYDHGLTIPRTLPAAHFFESMREKFGSWNDGEKIRAAMEVGRSATGAEGRGFGLQNFLQLIKTHRHSRLRIISRNGVLSVQNRGEESLAFDSMTVETSLQGTLIEWQFVPNNVIT